MRVNKDRTALGMLGATVLSISLALLPYPIGWFLLDNKNISAGITFFSFLAILVVIGVTCLAAGMPSNIKLLGYLSTSLQYSVYAILLLLTATSIVVAIIYQEFTAFAVFIIGSIATAALGLSSNYLWKNYTKYQPLPKSKVITLSSISIVCCMLISLITWMRGAYDEKMYVISMVFAASTIPYIISSLGFVMATPSSPKNSKPCYSNGMKFSQISTFDQELSSKSERGLMIQCHYCGKMVPVDSVYCAYCGRRLR